jgi:trk system potassium uptake protein TrkA
MLTANELVRHVRAMSASWEGSVETLYRIVGGQAEALGFTVPEGAPFLNVPLSTLHLKPNILVASIVRGQRVIIPKGNDCMLAGDSVVIVAETQRAVANLQEIFADSEGFVK